MAEFFVKTADVKRFERHLKFFAAKAVPHANRDAINGMAFGARKVWIKEVQQAFTLRNTWTTRQIRVVRATGIDMARMQSVVGSLAPYMDEREFGETKHKKGKHGIAIPTSAAAGQTGRRRTKVIQRRNALKAIRLHQAVRGGQKQRNAAAIRIAIKSGRRVVYLEKGNRRGLVRITGGKRRPKLRTLYDLSKATVKVKAEPTLGRTMEQATQTAPLFYKAALIAQLKRNRLFTDR